MICTAYLTVARYGLCTRFDACHDTRLQLAGGGLCATTWVAHTAAVPLYKKAAISDGNTTL